VDSARLLLPGERVALQAQANLKRYNATKKEWANFDKGDLHVLLDSASGRSRVVFTPPSAPKPLLNAMLGGPAVKVGSVEDVGATGKARFELTLPVDGIGLARHVVTTRTLAEAEGLVKALRAAKAPAA
jgi:hypothetical protein